MSFKFLSHLLLIITCAKVVPGSISHKAGLHFAGYGTNTGQKKIVSALKNLMRGLNIQDMMSVWYYVLVDVPWTLDSCEL